MVKKSLIRLATVLTVLGTGLSAHAEGLLNIGLTPIVINGYYDNTACLKNPNVQCGPEMVREGTVDVVFKSVTGYGYFGVRQWDTSNVRIIAPAGLSSTVIPINDDTGKLAYELHLDGEIEITEKFYTVDQFSFHWAPCGGDQNKKSLSDVLNGVPLRCKNDNVNSFLTGYKLRYVLKAKLFRKNNADLRSVKLPSGISIAVNAIGESMMGGGKVNWTDTKTFFDGGSLRLNDRKCYINLTELKVNFGDLSPTSPEMLKSEKMTPIPLFCSGFATQIDGKDYQINGSGIRNVINGISIQAKTVADGNDKRIAVPDQDNLFVEVGPIQAGVCNAGSSVLVNGQKIETVGQSQVNGPVFNDQLGYQDGTPINLFWRLCQKKPSEPLTAGKLKDEVAATIRVHYN